MTLPTNITPNEARVIRLALDYTDLSISRFYGQPIPPELNAQDRATLFELCGRFKRLARPAEVVRENIKPNRKD